MKKTILCFSIAVALCAALPSLYAQSLVSTQPHNRVVVLEEFTGINCGYCPDGHRIANNLKDKYNGEPILINIHSGGYATPSNGQPDFRTDFGEAIDKQAGVTGYPAGTINRKLFPEMSKTLSLNRGQWELAAEELMKMPSPANVGLKSSFNSATRELTVDVEVYYTDDAPQPTNALNVVLVENDVIGYQSDYSSSAHKDYHHKHMLRYMLAGQWGEEISPATKGTLIKKTYTYVVPDDFNVNNCEVAAFVSEGQKDIYSGAQVVADGGTTQITATLATDSPVVLATATPAQKSYTAIVASKLPATEMFSFETVPSLPEGWTSTLMVDGSAYSGGDVSIATGGTKNISLNITPNSKSGVGMVDVFIHSKTYPKSPVIKRTFYLMSGVNDLLMSHPDATKYDSVYTAAMSAANLTTSGKMDRNVFELFAQANAFDGVKNVYYNVSWAFPGLTETTMNTLKAMMDKGINVFIAGQDFAWDAASGDTNAHGNTLTKEFLNTYLMTNFIADGNSLSSQLTSVKSEPIFRTVPNSAIANPYGGNNLYPEQVSPLAGAAACFTYNNNNGKVGGVRGQRNDYKVVYLGVGLEQVSEATANEILARAAKWFRGEISTVEFDDLNSAGITVYPVPATTTMSVRLPEEVTLGKVRLYDLQGNMVKEQAFAGQQSLSINVEDVASGAYRLYIENSYGGRIATGMVSVVR